MQEFPWHGRGLWCRLALPRAASSRQELAQQAGQLTDGWMDGLLRPCSSTFRYMGRGVLACPGEQSCPCAQIGPGGAGTPSPRSWEARSGHVSLGFVQFSCLVLTITMH